MAVADIPPALATRLHTRTQAARWGLSVGEFGEALSRIVAQHGPPSGDQAATERFLLSLHLDDLALACACAAGAEAAWEHFIREYRPTLRRTAMHICGGDAGLDLADSLYADLYGLTERDGERRSLFRYFSGRSILTTWLRAVMAQRHVDRVRSTKRLVPLPDDPDSLAASLPPAATPRPRLLNVLGRAVAVAVAKLDDRDRLRLACYYSQNLTLAQIGRALGEHEATASRHLTKTRRVIRADVEHQLRNDHHMSTGEIDECFASAVEDAGELTLEALLPDGLDRKNPPLDRSQREGRD